MIFKNGIIIMLLGEVHENRKRSKCVKKISEKINKF